MVTNIPKVSVVILFIAVYFYTTASAQDTAVRSVNNEFTLEVHRDSSDAVSTIINFTDPSKFSNLTIEKGRWSDGEFRRCAYFDLKNPGIIGGSVEAKDSYPLNPFYDVYYRVKAVTSNGDEKIYPPILLPAKMVPVPKIEL